MQLVQQLAVNSDCYKSGRTIQVQGIVLHSVGCPQENPEVFAKKWNQAGQNACVHAVLGADGRVIQCLPWTHRGWHVGGAANNTHIGVEMCEPSTIKYTGSGASWVETGDGKHTEEYVRATYKVAIELFAFLCKEFQLDPLKEGVIISHSEAHKQGKGSNHADVEHIWVKFGLTMQGFRQAIADKMKEGSNEVAPSPSTNTEGVTKPMTERDRIHAFLKEKIGNEYGVCGLMGNIQAESAFKSNNLQNSFNKRWGIDDETYTEQIDKGQRTFLDGSGYGICQWTSSGRKQGLLELVKSKGVSVSDLVVQLEWLWVELTTSYKGVLNTLQNANSIKEASDKVLTGFERPRDQSESVKEYRAKLSQEVYDYYSKEQEGSNEVAPLPSQKPEIKYVVRTSYSDKGSQIGAFNQINNAIMTVEENTPYKIFNYKTGELIYESCYSKLGRPQTFKVKAIEKVRSYVQPSGAEAGYLEPGEYEVAITFSRFGLILGEGWIDLGDIEIEKEEVKEESLPGIKFTDKNGDETTFTEVEWTQLIKKFVFTGKAEEIINLFTVTELRAMLNS